MNSSVVLAWSKEARLRAGGFEKPAGFEALSVIPFLLC
ncbi:hypothetical protein ApDm4_1259 [Acetobacter pomorum]|nr:hypothetical protein ApDm4_1259 [Acetobacter pomorum]